MRLQTMLYVMGLVLFAPCIAASKPVLKKIGMDIHIPFPNKETIMGVGGLVFHNISKTWTVCAENIPGSTSNEDYPLASSPRLYHMNLDFESGSADFLEEVVTVQPSKGLKLEDIAFAPSHSLFSSDPSSLNFWLVSESNSDLPKTNKFLSKDFGAPDLSSFDPDTLTPSRLIRVNGGSGAILEEAKVPEFAHWDFEYDWESTMCVGDRPFQGFHALATFPSSDSEYEYMMAVASQTALFQDGSSPTEFAGSATRILMYGIKDSIQNEATATYLKSLRYDTSRLTLTSYQKGARHFNGLSGIIALNETSFLVAELEDLTGFGTIGQKTVNRIFFIDLDFENSVDHCQSLLSCDVLAPTKKLVWERKDDKQLDGLAWGPVGDDGRPTVALTFENDEKFGAHFELFSLDLDSLSDAPIWDVTDNKDNILKRRVITIAVTVALLAFFVTVQFWWVRRLDLESPVVSVLGAAFVEDVTTEGSSNLTCAHYAMVMAMMNSFLVGGLTFGFSGMVLILRKEGIYAESCACGSFCAKQKESLALISTVGFAAAIGSRLFIGFFMDSQGPKSTAILCSFVCLSGFVLIASEAEDNLSSIFLLAWVLLSLGGSGLHLTGFHFTNLFKGDAKKAASAGISAAFGASSAIFPIMQFFNQYAGVSVQSMATFYSAIVLVVALNNLFVQPWSKVEAGVPFNVDFNIFRSAWWERNLKRKPILSSVLRECVKFQMWGETLFYSVSLLLLTHYISTSAQLLYEKGDAPFTSNPNDWSDYIFTRTAGWFNALGFLWFPTVQYFVKKLSWPTCYIILGIVNIIIVGIVLARSLELQILGFVLLSFARLMLFTFHHTYILDVFGIEHFGTLNGLSSLIAALLGFVSYPLQLFALSTSYTVSFIPVGVCILLSIGFPLLLKKLRITNWAETVAVDPGLFRYPVSIAEVVSLVKNNEKIRCAGALHSCAPLIASEGIILSLTKMNKILEIDVDRKIVRCQAGVKCHELCEALKPHGLAVGTLGTIDWQTITGAVMTGTHGGGLTIPSLHTFIISYKLVKADGSIVIVSKDAEPVLFSALAPSMGMFGVAVEVEMRCVPLEFLEAKLEVITFDELIFAFEGFMKDNKYARVVVYPSINKATIWSANPISSVKDAVAKGAISSSGYNNFRNETEKAMLEQYLILCDKKCFDKADSLLEKILASQLHRLHHYVGQYNHVLCKERNNGIPHADIEFNFDFKKNREVLETVRDYCKNDRMPYYNFEMRTTKRDDAMLSCCYGRDGMWIDFQAKAAVAKDFFETIEHKLKPIGFRKHWAKGLDNTDPEYVVKQFPMVPDFMELLNKIDPHGKFRNKQGDSWHDSILDCLHKMGLNKHVLDDSDSVPTEDGLDSVHTEET